MVSLWSMKKIFKFISLWEMRSALYDLRRYYGPKIHDVCNLRQILRSNIKWCEIDKCQRARLRIKTWCRIQRCIIIMRKRRKRGRLSKK